MPTPATPPHTDCVPNHQDTVTRRNIEAVARLEAAALERRSAMDCLIDYISAFCGSTAFLVSHTLWFATWITLNTLPGLPHFDKYPFQFLTFVVSLEAIMLSTFILISQNRQSALQERRNHLDLQINLLAEQESTKTLVLLARIAEKLGVEGCDAEDVRELEADAEPDRLVAQIEETLQTVAAP